MWLLAGSDCGSIWVTVVISGLPQLDVLTVHPSHVFLIFACNFLFSFL